MSDTKELRRLLGEVLPSAPWSVDEASDESIYEARVFKNGHTIAESDWPEARLLAAARNQLPALLDRLEALEAAARKAVEAFRPALKSRDLLNHTEREALAALEAAISDGRGYQEIDE